VRSYLMEDPREDGRLTAKVDAAQWTDQYLSAFLAEGQPTGLRANGRVLEVGCGPGHLLAEVSRRRPDLLCVGVDLRAPRVTERGPRPGISFTVGRAEQLPFEDGRLDLVYCRFLLEYLTHPELAMAEMVRVCKPLGAILVQDLDGQLVNNYPTDPELDADLTAVLAALQPVGFDPYVGRRLYHLAHSSGLTGIAVKVEGYHVIAGPIPPEERSLWALKLAIARPAIVGALDDFRADAAIRRYLHYLDRADTLTFSTQFTVRGTVACRRREPTAFLLSR
jgi:SAM-dependent methyltransferase